MPAAGAASCLQLQESSGRAVAGDTVHRLTTDTDNCLHMLGEQEKNFARIMVTPAVALLFLVTIAPLLFSLGVSFTNLQFGSPQPLRWTGLDNYVNLIARDSRFLSALWRTILLVIGGVVTQTVLGYVIASLLFRIRRGRTIL